MCAQTGLSGQGQSKWPSLCCPLGLSLDSSFFPFVTISQEAFFFSLYFMLDPAVCLFLVWVFIFFLFISFCMISESWWKSFFDNLFESSCSTSTSFTSCFLLRFSIYSLCKIFLRKAQMLKGIFPFSYILFPEAEADKQFPTLLQISQPGMVWEIFFLLKIKFLNKHWKRQQRLSWSVTLKLISNEWVLAIAYCQTACSGFYFTEI